MQSNLFCNLRTLKVSNLWFTKQCFATGSFPNDRDEYLYNTHNFRVVEEEQESLHRYRRTSIEYQIGHSSKAVQIRTCEVDALRMVDLTSNSDTLFSMLVKKSYDHRSVAACQTMFGKHKEKARDCLHFTL